MFQVTNKLDMMRLPTSAQELVNHLSFLAGYLTTLYLLEQVQPKIIADILKMGERDTNRFQVQKIYEKERTKINFHPVISPLKDFKLFLYVTFNEGNPA